jgi:predicted Zn-dependent protease
MPALGAGIYRTVGPDGAVTYSDVPTGPTAQLVEVAIVGRRSSAAPPVAAQPRSQPGAPTNEQPPKGPYPEAETRSPEQEAADNAAKCAAAREKAQRLAQSRRIYRTGASGERAYLNDAGIEEARAHAASDAEKACSGSSAR